MSSQNENWNPPEKSEKQSRWEQLSDEAQQIKDQLGKGLDEGIQQTVIALKAHGFPTNQSCEGHAKGEHGHPYPWVQVGVPEPKGWQDDEEKQKEWMRQNYKEEQKIRELLTEFYRIKTTPADIRIIPEKIGIFGSFRIQSAGAEALQESPVEELPEKVKMYQQEMNDFTQFLKEKYFKE